MPTADLPREITVPLQFHVTRIINGVEVPFSGPSYEVFPYNAKTKILLSLYRPPNPARYPTKTEYTIQTQDLTDQQLRTGKVAMLFLVFTPLSSIYPEGGGILHLHLGYLRFV